MIMFNVLANFQLSKKISIDKIGIIFRPLSNKEKQMILNQIDKIPNSLIKSGGLKIYTALDMDAQTNIENAINNLNKSLFIINSIHDDIKKFLWEN